MRVGEGKSLGNPPKRCSEISTKTDCLQILRCTFTDLNDLGKRIVLLNSWYLIWWLKRKYSLDFPAFWGYFERWGLFRVFFTNCCSAGLRIWFSGRTRGNPDHLIRFYYLILGREGFRF